MPQDDTNERVVRRFWEEVWNQKRVDVLEELTTDDFISCGPDPLVANRQGFRSLVEIRAWAERSGGSGPPPRFHLDEILECGDTVAVRGHWTDAPPVDWAAALPGITLASPDLIGVWLDDQQVSLAVHHLEGGKIQRQWLAGLGECKFFLEHRDHLHEGRGQ